MRRQCIVRCFGISLSVALHAPSRWCSQQKAPPAGESSDNRLKGRAVKEDGATAGSPEAGSSALHADEFATREGSGAEATTVGKTVAGGGDDTGNSPTPVPQKEDGGSLATPEPEPVRWLQEEYVAPEDLPIVDEKGEYIVSRVQWPTGEIAYTTPPPVDDKLAPRFGYNVVQVKKHVSWWKYNQKYPRLSLAYINIQVLFLLGLAWLTAFLADEHRRTTEAMKTPGAMVGEHRGRGPVTNKAQKIEFSSDEMSALVDKAQGNWFDGAAEANYIGSKDYR